MNVLIIPSWYKTEKNPTLGSFFREQAFALKKRGVNVIVADVTYLGREEYFSKKNYRLLTYEDEGMLTYSFNVPAFGKNRMKDGGVKGYQYRLDKVISKIRRDGINIDLIHAHSYLPAGVAATRIGKKLNIPVVVTEHSSDVIKKDLSFHRRLLLTEVVDGSDEFICVSNGLRESVKIITNTEKEILVVPNMVLDTFERLPSKKEKFCFISIGNLIQTKRFDLVIKAFALGFCGNKNFELNIVGDGKLRDELQRLVNVLDVSNQVNFLGRLTRDEVMQEINKNNVLVLASDNETFGVVYIEALSCGIPVIGTRNGGAEDIISDDNGFLVNKNNVDELGDAMLNMYKNYNSYNLETISQKAKSKYSEFVISSRLIAIYDSINKK